MVRKASKEHGTKKEFEGDLNRGDRVLFVEDVVTSGGTLRGAIERLRGHGAVIEDCVCVVDREEGGKLCSPKSAFDSMPFSLRRICSTGCRLRSVHFRPPPPSVHSYLRVCVSR